MKKLPLSIRTTQENKNAWEKEAKRQGVSLTAFMESACNAASNASHSLEERVAKLEERVYS
jgi:uncharacterized protein (DUF1778 family)